MLKFRYSRICCFIVALINCVAIFSVYNFNYIDHFILAINIGNVLSLVSLKPIDYKLYHMNDTNEVIVINHKEINNNNYSKKIDSVSCKNNKYTSGKWVFNSSTRNHYSFKNKTEYLDWMPDECILNDIDYQNFCQNLNQRNIYVVGDSLQFEFFVSMYRILSTLATITESGKNKSIGNLIRTRDDDNHHYKGYFNVCNESKIIYLRNHFLSTQYSIETFYQRKNISINSTKIGFLSHDQYRNMTNFDNTHMHGFEHFDKLDDDCNKLSEICVSFTKYANINNDDIWIMETGAHNVISSLTDGTSDDASILFEKQWQRMSNVISFFFESPIQFKGNLIIKTLAPPHLHCGEIKHMFKNEHEYFAWNDKYTHNWKYNWERFSEFNKLSKQIVTFWHQKLNLTRKQLSIIDVWPMMLLRGEAHRIPQNNQDCLHHSVPGPQDTYIILLANWLSDNL